LVSPGHSMRYEMLPLASRHIQVRQVPLRHERGSRTWPALAASSTESGAGDANVYPCGSIRTIGGAGGRVIWNECGKSGSVFDESLQHAAFRRHVGALRFTQKHPRKAL
jgi:hypothetical protein